MARFNIRALAGVASVILTAACAVDSPTEADEAGDPYAGTTAEDGEDQGDGGDDGDEGGGAEPNGQPDPGGDSGAQGMMLQTGCTPYGADVYTPFKNYGPVSSGNVAMYPWRGSANEYPATIEDFRAYSTPTTVECSDSKSARDYLDVTSGCLNAVSASGGVSGQIKPTSTGYYRSFALAHDAANQRQVAWTDQGVEYRFKYSEWTGNVSGPGFKAFVRYLTEYDLYVASWRMDGVVQIQKKQCGQYTVIARNNTYGQPSPNVWHTIRFEVVGNQLRLYLDGALAMTATDDSIKRGTAGIRIDSADGALIDDWKVYAP